MADIQTTGAAICSCRSDIQFVNTLFHYIRHNEGNSGLLSNFVRDISAPRLMKVENQRLKISCNSRYDRVSHE